MLQKKVIKEHIGSKLEKIKTNENKIHAFKNDGFKKELVEEQLNNLLKKSNDNISSSPLSGYLLGVKDIFIANPFPTHCGSNLPEHLFIGTEASSVTKMREAGCIVAGKTVTTEFAISYPGETRNPCNLEHTPGGSSSGSAAAVSAGFVDIAFGSQTNGSVIRPAAFCGVIGFKPTYGRVSLDGVIPFCPSTDHIGIFVNELELLNLTMAQLDSDWKKNLTIDENKIVFGIPVGEYLKQADKNGLDNFWRTVETLRNSGIEIKEIPYLNDIDLFNIEFEKLIYGELARIHKDWFKEFGNLYRPKTAECITAGQKVSEDELDKLRKNQLKFIDEIKTVMQNGKIDAWVVPSAKGVAPKGLEKTGLPAMNSVWSFSRLPAISIVSGKEEESNLPFGLQIVGKYNEDEALLGIAKK